MNPIAPDLAVLPVDTADAGLLLTELSRVCASVPYSSSMNVETLRREVLADAPPCVFPVRWQRHLRLAAWRARLLVGFADIAVGFDSESMHLPDYQPLGLLRFLSMSERRDVGDEAAKRLLDAAESFWRQAGIGRAKAFHLSTGYPSLQAGAGLLPGDWAEHVRLLTEQGYFLTRRYYCLYRSLDEPVEERVPLVDLSLVYRGTRPDRTYEVYRRTELIARAHVVTAQVNLPGATLQANSPHSAGQAVAHLTSLHVMPQWRGQDVGKWLLRRILADAALQELAQIIVFVAQGQYAALALFAQQGFEELNYRGYELEKVLTE